MINNIIDRCVEIKIPKSNAFNAVRLLCCFIVIALHIFVLNENNSPVVRFLDGHVAVCVFFILSGFWITKSYLTSKDLKTYFLKRIKRILPLYYSILIFSVVLFSFFSKLDLIVFYKSKDTYKYLFWNMLFLNFKCPSLPGCFESLVPVNGALWTIKIEIAFYVLLPFIIEWFKRIGKTSHLILVMILLYFSSVFYTFVFKNFSTQMNLPKQLVNQFPAFLSCFLCGMFFLFFWEDLLKRINFLMLPAIVIFVLHYITDTEFMLMPALTIIVFFVALKLHFLDKFGARIDLSYEMYLLHCPIIQILKFLGYYKLDFTISFILTYGIVFLLSYLISFLFHLKQIKKGGL